MLSLPPRRLAPALALSLLCLTPLVRAQTPATKPSAVLQVRLQVDFVSASTTDLDNLGVPFDPAPIALVKRQPAPQQIQLRTATGNIVSQLYQTLIRTRGTVVHAPAAVSIDNVSAKFAVNSHVIYYPYRVTTSSIGDPKLRETRELTLQASIAITPRVNSDGSVTLQIVTEAGSSITRTTENGQMMVLAGLPLSKEKQTGDQELLVFVTPTVLGRAISQDEAAPSAAPVTDTGQPDPPMPGITDTPAEAKRQINLDVYNADLGTVTAMLQTHMGVLISLQVGGQPFRNVSVHLEHATPSAVLRAVARSAGGVLTRKANGEYLFSKPLPALATSQVSQAAPGAYGRYTVLLPHTTPGEMLARLFQTAPERVANLSAWLKGVQTVGAVPGNDALRVEATEEGLRRFQTLVSVLDPAGRRIQLATLLVAVPITRTDFSVQAPPDALLAALRQGNYRVIKTPTVMAVEDRDTGNVFYYTPPPPVPTTMPPKTLLLISDLLANPGFTPLPGDNVWSGSLGTPITFQLTPRFGDADVIALNLEVSGQTVRATQPVRLGQLAVAELPHTAAAPAERLFLFLRPTLLPNADDSGQAVIITP